MKYGLTEETKMVDGEEVCRIVCTEAFSDVQKGDKGGWVKNVRNISHLGECWAYDECVVMNEAELSGDATLRGNIHLRDDVVIYDNVNLQGTIVIDGVVEMLGQGKLKAPITVETGCCGDEEGVCLGVHVDV